MGTLQERPALTRAIGALQIAGGIWWALRQEHEQQAEQPLPPEIASPS
jgi:hypothetical protein